MNILKNFFKENKFFLILILLIILVRSFLFDFFLISWYSMYPTLDDHNLVLLTHIDQKYERWDIIIFDSKMKKSESQKNWRDAIFWEKNLYIKRIIWVEGDTLKFDNWEVYLKKEWEKEFKKLDENFLDTTNKWKTYVNQNDLNWVFLVEKWMYFVMWDNRNWSTDSRVCFYYSCENSPHEPFVSKKDIVWKILWKINF